ncbi:MAG: nucleotide pyrophosphohydrolase [Promethearchaeota archaeon]
MDEINDQNTPVSYFKNEIMEFIKSRNWVKYHTPKNLIQALMIEAAELSQCFLFKEDTIDYILKDKILLANISDEICDVFIYLISLINVLGLDLTKAFIDKMEKNKKKYSEKEFNDGRYYKK